MFRAEEAAAKTATALAALGHEALPAPVTRIVSCLTTLPEGQFDAIVATSANAFPPGIAETEHGGSGLRRLPVFAVGQATRDAARRAGFHDARVAQGDAASLVALLRLTARHPARLLYLAGRDRKPAVETSLVEAGYEIDTVIAYEAEAVERWPDSVTSALRTGQVGAALHFSRRSAQLALALAARHGLGPALLSLPQCCLSDDVALPLREAGASHIRVAADPDEASLLDLLRPGGR